MSTKEDKVDAWMPLWIGSYLADTMDLTRDEHGGYLLLLIAYWRNKGPLADNDKKLSTITRCKGNAEWKRLREVLAPYFDVAEGVWRHGRADKELTKAGQHKAAATAKAKAGAEARWKKGNKDAPSIATGNAPSIDEALPGQSPTPTPTPLGSVANATAAGAASGSDDKPDPKPEKSPEDMAKAELWRAAVSVLENGGCPPSQCRTFMGKLVQDYGFEVVKEAVSAAVTMQPADAREYLRATCMRRKGERKDPVTVPSDDEAKTKARNAADDALLASQDPAVRAKRIADAKALLAAKRADGVAA